MNTREVRALNLEVADRIFNWRPIEQIELCLPNYSSRIEHAWKVIEILKDRKITVEIDNHGHIGYRVTFTGHGIYGSYIGPDVSEAICHAGLRALGKTKYLRDL
jgi:hypothetical protein